jgi:ribosomal protein L40E
MEVLLVPFLAITTILIFKLIGSKVIKEIDSTQCRECLSKIPKAASKCKHCGSDQSTHKPTVVERIECKSCSTPIPIKAQKCIHCGANQPLT